MAEINFKMFITNQGVTYARQVKDNPGWHLKPKRWIVSEVVTSFEKDGEFKKISLKDCWWTSPFSGLLAEGENRLLHGIVFPPNIDTQNMEKSIAEIYFIYEDIYGNEFLYAIARPENPVIYTPGVTQSYYFAFTLNNATVADTFTIDYTYPQDIEDHNNKLEVHTNLLKRDGSRTASGILSYDKDLEFTNDFDIINKKYADSITDYIKNLIDTIYCPPGTMMWYPSPKVPEGWLLRDGGEHEIQDYLELYKVIGDIYSSEEPTREGYFRVPDDRGLFIRGWDDGKGHDIARIFGSYQEDGVPDHTHKYIKPRIKGGSQGQGGNPSLPASENAYTLKVSETFDDYTNPYRNVYKDIYEVRVKNRAYLPIIKY